MKTKSKPRPSNQAQRISAETWYYERRGKLTMVAWIGEPGTPSRACAMFNVPWKMLMASAKRCRPEQVR